MEKSPMKILLVCLFLLSLAGCSQNPATARQDFVMVSESQEIGTGRRDDAEVRKQYHVYAGKSLQDYVDCGDSVSPKQRPSRPAISVHRINGAYPKGGPVPGQLIEAVE
jgi:predicted Zn-dependent protease